MCSSAYSTPQAAGNKSLKRFKTIEEAVQYAQHHKIELLIEEPKRSVFHPKNYSDNFSFDRVV
jgi:ETC complex I subunit conserved region